MAKCNCTQGIEKWVKEEIEKHVKTPVLSVNYKDTVYKFAVQYEGAPRPRTVSIKANPHHCPICGKQRVITPATNRRRKG